MVLLFQFENNKSKSYNIQHLNDSFSLYIIYIKNTQIINVVKHRKMALTKY